MTVKKKKTKRIDYDEDMAFEKQRKITTNRRPIRDWTKVVSNFDDEDIDYLEDIVDSRK